MTDPNLPTPSLTIPSANYDNQVLYQVVEQIAKMKLDLKNAADEKERTIIANTVDAVKNTVSDQANLDLLISNATAKNTLVGSNEL